MILGGILIDNRLMNDVVGLLNPSDFYSSFHAKVYRAMVELYKNDVEIDPVLIGEEMKKAGHFENSGGIATITNLTFGLPHFNNINTYLEIVKSKTKARDLIKACNSTIAEVLNDDDELDTILDKTEQTVFNLRQEEGEKNHSFGSILEERINALKIRTRSDYQLTGLQTGFRGLDNRLMFIRETDLVILGGRPSQGKSTLGLNIINNIANDYEKVIAVFSLEMDKEQLTDKIVCSDAGVDYKRYQMGNLDQSSLDKISQSFSTLYDKQIIIDDSSALNPLQLKARVRRIIQQRKRLDLIVIDYLQMMRGVGKFQNRENEVAQISKDLKAICKDLKVPILAICSLNRASEARADKKPTMGDLRESGQIESDADKILFVHRPEMYAKDDNEKQELLGQAEIIIAKNRQGETGFETLGFDGKKSRFLELY